MIRTLLLLVAVALTLPTTASADPSERVTTIADGRSLNVTVYNGGIGLIHDRRRVALDAGLNRVAWRDVSRDMDPTSAQLEAIGAPTSVRVVEQNFNYDLLDPSALLQRYVGQEVTVVHDARFAGERDTRERARILSTNGGIVLQYRDRIETSLRGHLIFPAAPKNFRDRPTLDLDLASTIGGSPVLDLSYITRGLTWRADYVGVVAADDSRMELNGLVTLSNNSGASYDNARLQLVAGNVNVAQVPVALKEIARTTSDVYSVNGARVSEESYFEYHLYTLSQPTSILDNQTKQVSLLSARDIPVRHTLELRGSPNYYRSQEPDLGDRIPVGVYVTFENRGGQLGIPLPSGIVRLYKRDSRGLSLFIGSDAIDHTPKNEVVRMHVGNSFDVTARKRQTSFSFVGPSCDTQSSYDIVLANAKPHAETVRVIEPIPGEWWITEENMPHLKSSASTATWDVQVPANDRAHLQYTARSRWCWSN